MSSPSSPATPTRAGYAIAALVVGLFAIFARFASAGAGLVLGIAAVVCAVLALRQIGKGHSTGRGMAVWGLVLGLLVALSGLGGLSSGGAKSTVAASTSGDSTSSTPATPTTISATAMADDFERNQPAAEKKWGGQFVQFTAPVSNIKSSSVSFTDVTSKYSFTQISCEIADENSVLSLSKGSPTTVRGVVSGNQILGVITLNDCQIVGH